MPRKALVVDSDIFYVEALTKLLEGRGYEVKKAYDGKQGISLLEENRVNIVFLDILLPVIDGLQVIQLIRQKFMETPIPIIVVSGAIIEQIGDIEKMGANYYIAKGPMKMLTEHIHQIVDKIENDPLLLEFSAEVIEPCKVYPRRATSDLLAVVKFQRSIIESFGIGVLVLAKDTRIISANSAACEIFHLPDYEMLNRPVQEIIPIKERTFFVEGLKTVLTQQDKKTANFSILMDSRPVRFVVSLFKAEEEILGWVIGMYNAEDAL
jgi:PAS domain S-box-containing protein